MSFRESKRETFTWAFDLDPAARPAAITLRNLDGANQGKAFPGVYRRDGDALKVCFDPTGGKRPAGFETAADSGAILILLTRVK